MILNWLLNKCSQFQSNWHLTDKIENYGPQVWYTQNGNKSSCFESNIYASFCVLFFSYSWIWIMKQIWPHFQLEVFKKYRHIFNEQLCGRHGNSQHIFLFVHEGCGHHKISLFPLVLLIRHFRLCIKYNCQKSRIV